MPQMPCVPEDNTSKWEDEDSTSFKWEDISLYESLPRN